MNTHPRVHTAQISLRLPADELARWRDLAARSDLPLSELLRQVMAYELAYDGLVQGKAS